MKITKLLLETKLFSRNVYHIDFLSGETCFQFNDEKFVREFNPYYIQCVVLSSDLRQIQSLEDEGFRFAEFRVIKTLSARDFNPISPLAFYPFQLQQIINKSDLKKAISLITSSIRDDRFSCDPLIEPGISKARTIGYLKKSFSSPSQFIYGLRNMTSGELVAVKTGEYLTGDEVQFYLTGVAPNQDDDKLINMLDTLLIGFLASKKFHWFHSISSGFNVAELNQTRSNLNFQIISTSVILRKIYR